MFCKECGKKVSDDSKFCCYCGTELTEENDVLFKSRFSAFENLYDDLKVSNEGYKDAKTRNIADGMTLLFSILNILGDIVD